MLLTRFSGRNEHALFSAFLGTWSSVNLQIALLSMPTQQALQERDAAQHKVQEMIAQHHAEIEDLRAQLAKVFTALD